MFPGGGLVGAWLPFGEVIVNLIVDPRVRCEGDYSSLNVVSFLVYRHAAPGVYGHPERVSSPGGVFVFLSGVCLPCLGLARCQAAWPCVPCP